ncbi:MAG: hypothetical protein G8237_03475 [Magnetococcales bacterium]|nr:hypothetical protein [Magnetococcales bacterium]NGZ05394.1 hypothetical protein [Magnetococcales bacterium]
MVDELRKVLASASMRDIVLPVFSLFAFSEVQELLERLGRFGCFHRVVGIRFRHPPKFCGSVLGPLG